MRKEAAENPIVLLALFGMTEVMPRYKPASIWFLDGQWNTFAGHELIRHREQAISKRIDRAGEKMRAG